MRRAFFLLAALLLVCLPARAEGDVRAVVDALDLQGFEETVGETGIDARELLISIASGEERSGAAARRGMTIDGLLTISTVVRYSPPSGRATANGSRISRGAPGRRR